MINNIQSFLEKFKHLKSTDAHIKEIFISVVKEIVDIDITKESIKLQGESIFLQIILFFLALSFGFVRFYKENMFRADTQNEQYFYLQETRRICFWSYKQILKIKLKRLFSAKNSATRNLLQQQEQHFIDLHIQLIRYENDLCKTHKHVDVETYLDSLM